MAGSGLQPALIAIIYLCPAVSGATVGIRVWRKRKNRSLGGDDALICLAWLLSMVNTVIIHFYVLKTYTGYHDEDIPRESIDWKSAAKWKHALATTYNPVICLVKASFLWSLQKLRSRNIWIRRCLWAIQVINAGYLISVVVANLIPCLPLARQFDKTVPGTCYDAHAFVVGTISVVLITDAMVLVMPSWILYDLQMPLRRKLVTISFLSLGFLVMIIGGLRLQWLSEKFRGKGKSYSIKQSYSALETNIAIIGACGPTIKYLFSLIIPGLRPHSGRKRASNYGPGSRDSSHITRTNEGTARQEDIEMNSDWHLNAHSDEHPMTAESNEGIMKTINWTVSSAESITNRPTTKDAQSDSRVAIQPTQVL
ncbi:hypothetical protein BCR34DRAFT_667896 [Clohesyomyces aquaticus]|uniref:Rhodopsin domain-containing protein n=1 Tax=Clohesyomyces aquaticus TaxID=1231657 RepID=A0A1Y1YUL1_9PLEO|nr:hypothetical protein BCR34DRAFT_667896 [Clohesyomyces aquaticus]